MGWVIQATLILSIEIYLIYITASVKDEELVYN
jgi:hypothetical protein